MLRPVYLLILISFIENISEGNVRLVCPVPISSRSDHTSGTCDLDASLSSKDITLLNPGLFTIIFEETSFQPSSPFRISLLDNTNEVRNTSNFNLTSVSVNETRRGCLLLDHIPHNNHAVITAECSHKANDYPLGVCKESTYHITIKIPDIMCEDCLFMLQQVVTNSEHQVCDITNQNKTTSDTTCITYTSCARVRLRPTVRGSGKNLSHCSHYLGNLPGDWPYRPQDLHQTDHEAILSLDLLHNDLIIEIPNDLNLGPIERVEIHHNLSKIWNVTVSAKDVLDNTGAVKVTWKNIAEIYHDTLKDGELVLNVVGSEKSQAANILYIMQHFSEGKLGALHDLYSETGWLVSHKFLGPHSEAQVAAEPWGQCVPAAIYFMALLQSVHVTSYGILGMTVLENRAYITAILHVDQETIQVIRIKGPELVAIPVIEITVPDSFDGVVQAAFDVTEHMPYINTVQFLKVVEVETDKEDAVLVGDLEEGMYTVLRDDSGTILGMGAFQFTQGQWMKVQVVVNKQLATIQSVFLHGPNADLVDLSEEAVHCSKTFCCLEGIVHEVTSELLLHLMKGHVTVQVSMAWSTVIGEVLISPLRYCRLMDGSCDATFHQFSLNGLGIEEHIGSYKETNASVWTATEAYVLDRSNVLHYCAQVDNLNKSLTASLVKEGSKIDSLLFEPLEEFSQHYIACNHIPLDSNHQFVDSLAQKSHSWLHFVISEGSRKLSSQHLPIIVRGECVISKIHEVGRGKDYWSHRSAPMPDMYAVAFDQLRFSTGTNTSLYLMASKEAMIYCNFMSAKVLFPPNRRGNRKEYYYNLTRTGSLYFADYETCNTTSPLKLVVHVTEGGNPTKSKVQDELCSMSVYSSWREKQLQRWQEPDVSGPVLIGLVVGLSSAGAFLLWQGIQLRQIPDSFRGSSDNVFIRF
ncbi:hypothetical protein BsWGS_10577 [Bradybaena similaris]